MHTNYRDILEATKQKPVWYDQNGTPRFAPFEPKLCPDIYSNVVVLARIACQACGNAFDVEMHTSVFDWRTTAPPSKWHYGDPPVHGCVGDTENCDDLAILEVWVHDRGTREWLRRTDLEGLIDQQAPDPLEE
jgi:hypothetical protein